MRGYTDSASQVKNISARCMMSIRDRIAEIPAMNPKITLIEMCSLTPKYAINPVTSVTANFIASLVRADVIGSIA